jgi:hypothetical protein
MMDKEYPFEGDKQCDFCGKYGTKDNPIYHIEDPYSAEIYDDHTLVWICDSCYDDRWGDI